MTSPDPELEALGIVTAALERLDDDMRARVIAYATDRFAVEPKQSSSTSPSAASPNEAISSIGHLFELAEPESGADRALAAGYWFQEVLGSEGLRGQDLNDALKEMGIGVSNITTTLGSLMNRTPAQIRQVSKTGKAAQGRKTYRLTSAGVASVNDMIAANRAVK